MKPLQFVCVLFAAMIAIGILYHASHGNLGIFFSTEGFLGVMTSWLLTIGSCGLPGLRSLIAALSAPAATDEQRQQAALVLETSGRFAHTVAGFLSILALIIIFQNLGSDISAIGGALAVALLMFLYATFYSEFIAAPLHTSVAPNARWSLTPLIASAILILAVLASFGFGTMACAITPSAPTPAM